MSAASNPAAATSSCRIASSRSPRSSAAPARRSGTNGSDHAIRSRASAAASRSAAWISGSGSVAPSAAATDWSRIADRYRELDELTGSPVVRLNRAVAVAEADGPLAGLCGRAVVVLDSEDKVVYCQLVPEIGQEPDYDAALRAAQA